jgi:hypothetical protein
LWTDNPKLSKDDMDDKKRAATERASVGRRVEVLCGPLATEPKLLDSGNTDLLEKDTLLTISRHRQTPSLMF